MNLTNTDILCYSCKSRIPTSAEVSSSSHVTGLKFAIPKTFKHKTWANLSSQVYLCETKFKDAVDCTLQKGAMFEGQVINMPKSVQICYEQEN